MPITQLYAENNFRSEAISRTCASSCSARRCRVVGRPVPKLLQPTAGCRLGSDALAERIRRARTRCLRSRKPAVANNDDPARRVVDKASAPFDTDPVVSSTRTAQWWRSSESADRCLGAKAADRLLEIGERRNCAGGSRENDHLNTDAFAFVCSHVRFLRFGMSRAISADPNFMGPCARPRALTVCVAASNA